jgi:hypothetical protein
MNGGERRSSCIKERLKAKQCAIRGDSTAGYAVHIGRARTETSAKPVALNRFIY